MVLNKSNIFYRGYWCYTEQTEKGNWRVAIVKGPSGNGDADVIGTREQGRLPGEFSSEKEAVNFAVKEIDRRTPTI